MAIATDSRRGKPDRSRFMKTIKVLTSATLMALGLAAGLVAQQSLNGSEKPAAPASANGDSVKKDAPKAVSLYRPFEINHIRPADQRGVNVFEAPKEEQVRFNGFTLSFGGA